jgi:nitrite reductase (NADH) large subunit
MGEPLVVIGNGMAAARFVEELAKRALGRYAVAVIGDEPRLAYNRVLLSALLAHEVGFPEIELKPAGWWRDRGVTLRYGVRATAVDPVARNVTRSNGGKLPFSKLVFATGSQPIKLRIPGMDLPGVFTFRDIDDVNTIAKAAGARAVVIGGGLLGLEAAYGLAKAGVQVTVLHLMDRLMERQLDAPAARMLARAVEAKGIAVRLETASIAASATGWWNPLMSKRRCWHGGFPAGARPMPAACPPPISRWRGSTCFRPAISSPPLPAPGRSC